MPAKRFRLAGVVGVALLVAALAAVAVARVFGSVGAGALGRTPAFVGSEVCGQCHASEYQSWKSSQHAVAMQIAGPGSVLGRFDGTRLTFGGVTSTFLKRGDRYVANTIADDGRLRDFEVRYTFGVWPLQQYLVDLPGGRLQPLPFGWDARPDEQGGQRWYSIDPEPHPSPEDPLFWTAWEGNWNYMCADCHSTGVRKGFDEATAQFHTTSAEISVGCEACHGPGQRHRRWASYPTWLRRIGARGDGLAPLTERRGVRWTLDSSAATAYRSAPRSSDHEIDVCAQCHSRRVQIADGYTAGAPFLDFHDPTLLMPGLHFTDGQQEDEVFTWSSFLQTKMYAAGVTCADCHDPHTQRTRQPGNAVCAQCHRATKYDAATHHFHPAGSTGAQCVACHMPPRNYMQIDPRHDHGIRIPRPDRSIRLGVPNACNGCHADRDAAWAAARVRSWFPTPSPGYQRFAEAFAADERDLPGAADSLVAVAGDASQPAVVRASALARLGAHPSAASLEAARSASRDPNPLVRRAALTALEQIPPAQRVAIAALLLRDDRRVARQQAAWLLGGLQDSLTSPEERRALATASDELVTSLRYNADRSSSRLTLGTFLAQRGELDSALVEYRAALALSPGEVQAYVNVAGVESIQGREAEAEATLREGLAKFPDSAALHDALGRSLVRLGRSAEALGEFEQAARHSTAAEFAYVYGVALHSAGRVTEAIHVLEASRASHPDDRDLLFALAAFYRDAGDSVSALRSARRLVEVHPEDARGQSLLRSLLGGRR